MKKKKEKLNLTQIENKKIAIYKKISQLKKEAMNETDEKKRKRINRQIKGLKDSLPSLKRRAYRISSKIKIKRQKHEELQREELIRAHEEAERKKLLERHLESRKERAKNRTDVKKVNKINPNIVCPSCESPFNYSSGFSRCRCN